MAIIALEGMHFRSYFGFYEEERITGNQFVVDVQVETNISKAVEVDELYEASDQEDEDNEPLSVNYEMIYELCKIEMTRKELSKEEIERRKKLPKIPGKIADEEGIKQPAKLLETLAQRIADRLHKQFKSVRGAKVRVKKLNPPLSGRVDCAWVEVSTGTFGIPTMKTLKKLRLLVKDFSDLKALDD